MKEVVGGHAVKYQKQIRNPSTWINHTGSVHFYWLVLQLINFDVKNNKEGGKGGRGVKESGGGGAIEFLPLKKESLLKRGGAYFPFIIS